jgi:hypothetical protein
MGSKTECEAIFSKKLRFLLVFLILKHIFAKMVEKTGWTGEKKV